MDFHWIETFNKKIMKLQMFSYQFQWKLKIKIKSWWKFFLNYLLLFFKIFLYNLFWIISKFAQNFLNILKNKMLCTLRFLINFLEILLNFLIFLLNLTELKKKKFEVFPESCLYLIKFRFFFSVYRWLPEQKKYSLADCRRQPP